MKWLRATVVVALMGAIAVAVAGLTRGRDLVSVGPIELLRPRALFILALLPLVGATLWLSLVDLRIAQQRLSALLRMLLVSCLAIALARPSTVGERRTVATVMLVDVSASIRDAQLQAARAAIEETRAARHGDDRLMLVTFGRHPRLVPLPPDGAPLPADALARGANDNPSAHGRDDNSDGSDLSAALSLAYGLYPPGTIKRALLVSDGNETEGDLAAEAAEAAKRGVHVDVIPARADAEPEVLVRALILPSDVKMGAPFDVTAEIDSTTPQTVALTLYRDEYVNPLEGRKIVALQAGPNVVKWKAEVAQAGFTTFKVQLAAAPGKPLADHFAGNNAAIASLAVQGKPRVLYVEGEPAAASYLANALKRENIDVDVRSSYGLPSSARDLAAYDLVILSDVAQTFVGPAQMNAIESYVRDLGGGFIMAGGENSFGAGGYTGSKLEKVLPVRFETEKKRDQPGLALALVIDRSGSMTGEKLELAKDASKATAELLGADDLIGVIAFDSQPTAVVRLQRAANRVRIAGDIARLQAGGGTNILPALKEAYDELDPAHAKLKHVILLTDGQASYEGIRELVDEMAEHKITISAVGVGAEADKTLLTMIAERGGGRFYFTQSAESIPRIFTKETTEVARNALVEEQVGVHVQKHAELLDGVGIAEAPPLRGYVSTKPKPLSDVILVSDLGEPILARWRVGLGQAAAFTSDVKNRWAVNWIKWPGYGKFWAHLVRSTMRHSATSSSSGRSFELSTEVDPPLAHVAVDAIGADDKFVSGLDTTLQVIDPARPSDKRELTMAETAPGHYEATFAPDRYGAFWLRAVHKQNGTVVAESAGALSLPYPREFAALPPDTALLERVAQVTGGRTSPTPQQRFDAGRQRVIFHRELWPWALWAALLLLLLDVAARRIRFV
ncbi:MAG TPA: VWA domain-containing protein, partial [Polyangia bacterium]|nr:VWA domain-containing protein [Polyangia bacterium]